MKQLRAPVATKFVIVERTGLCVTNTVCQFVHIDDAGGQYDLVSSGEVMQTRKRPRFSRTDQFVLYLYIVYSNKLSFQSAVKHFDS